LTPPKVWVDRRSERYRSTEATQLYIANMATPTYLTGDKAGIAEFIDKFEVRQSALDANDHG